MILLVCIVYPERRVIMFSAFWIGKECIKVPFYVFLVNYCPDPGIPINGFKNSSDYNMGAGVGFRCRSGHMLLGSEERECLPNRTWSGKEATCLGKSRLKSTIVYVGSFIKNIPFAFSPFISRIFDWKISIPWTY